MHMWNISPTTEDYREREGNPKEQKSRRERSHERLWTGKQTEVFTGGGKG